MRFELTRPFERYHLKVVRLPISPPTQVGAAKVRFWRGFSRFLGFSKGWLFFQDDAEGGAFAEFGLAHEERTLMVLLDDTFGEA